MEFVTIEHEEKTGRIEHLVLGNPENAKFIGSKTDELKELQYRACTAAQDYFMFGVYEGEVGLHLFKQPKEADFQQHIGYVAAWYQGDAGVPVPNAGWKPLYRRANNEFLGDFTDHKHAQEATEKHDIIDLYMSGGGLRLRMLSSQKRAEYWIKKFNGKVAVEKKDSQKRVQEAITVDLVSGRAKERRQPNGNSPTKAVKTDLNMPIKGGSSIKMSELPLGQYWLVNPNGRKIRKEEWKGTNIQMFASYASYGYKLDTLPESVPA